MDNNIYTVTTLCKNPKERAKDFIISGPVRCVGYYHKLEDAKEAVENNHCGIFECIYDYCVIEATHQGIYGGLRDEFNKEYWYEWKDDGYKEIEKPEEFKNSVCFGIG
jgi:hypothetical protein